MRTIEDDGFQIAARVYMVLEGENLATMAKTTGLGLLELATVFDNLKPDVVVTVADRYETLATAVAAAYMNIPVAHVQGGEVTGSIDEKVRHAVTKLADLHLVSTREGGRAGHAHGRGAGDGLRHRLSLDRPRGRGAGRARRSTSTRSRSTAASAHRSTSPSGYLVVMQHPVTTEYELARQQTCRDPARRRARPACPTLWFWPNVDAGSDGTSNAIRAFRELHAPRNIHFFKNMQPTDFLRLLYNSRCLVGNSSVGIRECSFLGVPVRQHRHAPGRAGRGPTWSTSATTARRSVAAMRRPGGAAGAIPSDPIYGTARRASASPSCSPTQPLSIEKRLTY